MMNKDRSEADRFTEICEPYAAMVYRHCLHMLKNHHDAQDAAQETMLRAFRSFSSYKGKGVATWLFRIAHNTCLDIVKSARYKRESATLDQMQDNGFTPVSGESTPEQVYERSAADDALWDAVMTLPQEQQTLLTLFYGEGMSYEELAKVTGMRQGTVKSRLNRAKVSLREKLNEAEL
ncbi:MAG: sigma-70 family RNA polymerase sigma factor [Clostridiales bacterium]|nr:sigma-70 family RNA polymerase sigma factor [Clostridiales bacterium]